MALFQEVKQLTASARKRNKIVYDVSFVVPRLAATWREVHTLGVVGGMSKRNAHSGVSSPNQAAPPTSSITLVLYGLSASYGQSDVENDASIEFRLGAFRMYGHDGVQLTSCGTSIDKWLHNFHLSESAVDELAVSLRLQWYTVSRERVASSSESLGSPLFASVKSRRHVFVEAVVANIVFFGDSSSLQYIHRKYCDYLESSASFYQSLQRSQEPRQYARQMCAWRSMSMSVSTTGDSKSSYRFPSIKLSIDVSVRGITIELPVEDSSLSTISLSCQTLSACCGDFLANTVWNKSACKRSADSGAGNRDLWATVDNAIGVKLRAVKTDLVHAIVFGVSDVELTMIATDGTKLHVTKSSWNAKGLVCLSIHQCHSQVPDISVDTFASALDLECRYQVTNQCIQNVLFKLY
jgi:hypothetical protein